MNKCIGGYIHSYITYQGLSLKLISTHLTKETDPKLVHEAQSIEWNPTTGTLINQKEMEEHYLEGYSKIGLA